MSSSTVYTEYLYKVYINSCQVTLWGSFIRPRFVCQGEWTGDATVGAFPHHILVFYGLFRSSFSPKCNHSPSGKMLALRSARCDSRSLFVLRTWTLMLMGPWSDSTARHAQPNTPKHARRKHWVEAKTSRASEKQQWCMQCQLYDPACCYCCSVYFYTEWLLYSQLVFMASCACRSGSASFPWGRRPEIW